MANIFRLILVLYLFNPAVSYSQGITFTVSQFTSSSPETSCDAEAKFYGSYLHGVVTNILSNWNNPFPAVNVSKQYATCNRYNGGVFVGSSPVFYKLQACASGLVRNSDTGVCEAPCVPGQAGDPVPSCGCASGLQPIGGVCEKDCTDWAGRIAGTSTSHALLNVENPRSYNGNQAFCVEGCAAVAQGGVKCHWNNDSNGDILSVGAYCAGQGPFQFNGRNCPSYGVGGISDVEQFEGEAPPPWWETGQDHSECSATGGAWGEVNGVQTCVGGGGVGVGGSGDGAGTGLGNKGGSETKSPETTTTTNPDGSTDTVTKSETTKCDGGNCQTTTTTTTGGKNADGSDKATNTTTTVVEKTQTAFCVENPKAVSCVGTEGDKSQWAGGCENGFTCTGDAVQCATAKAVWEQNCNTSWMNKANDVSGIGQSAVDALTGITAEEAERALNKSGDFDFDFASAYQEAQENYITFTKECISIPVIQIFGKPLEINAGILCDVGVFIRVMMHILAYMAVIRMAVQKF